ncbi:CvpA family protein [Methyloterricola oryzae]|uniref:CvpA family protein n=1 Tax=Methyloterricola oryzae TaxID=1495050 RepID=UPI00069C73CE|nr:CvpA family protein [Methyloterricola oryzae]
MPELIKNSPAWAGFAQGLNWADWCLLGLVGLSALIGLFRGLVREVFSLFLWAAAVWLGLNYSRHFAVHLEPIVPLPSARQAIAFVAVFFTVLVAGGLVGFILGKLVSGTGLSGTDRLAGLVFGVGRGIVIAALLVLLAGVTPLPHDPWWRESRLIPPFEQLALWLRDQLPAGLAGYVKYR